MVPKWNEANPNKKNRVNDTESSYHHFPSFTHCYEVREEPNYNRSTKTKSDPPFFFFPFLFSIAYLAIDNKNPVKWYPNGMKSTQTRKEETNQDYARR